MGMMDYDYEKIVEDRQQILEAAAMTVKERNRGNDAFCRRVATGTMHELDVLKEFVFRYVLADAHLNRAFDEFMADLENTEMDPNTATMALKTTVESIEKALYRAPEKKHIYALELSDSEVNDLQAMAAERYMTPEAILETFVGDLTHGVHSHGSDERMYAREWLDRCGFEYENKDYVLGQIEHHEFLEYLINTDNLIWFVDMQDAMNDLKAELEDLEEREQDPDRDQETIDLDREEKAGVLQDMAGHKSTLESMMRHFDDYAARKGIVSGTHEQELQGVYCFLEMMQPAEQEWE